LAKEKPSANKKKVQLRDLPRKEDNVVEKQWAQVVARAWSDEAFKRRLLAHPTAVLKEAGLAVPGGVQFKVVENTERLIHLILPPAPSGELAGEELLGVVGGHCRGCGGIRDFGGCRRCRD
jgi:hypothetical protein